MELYDELDSFLTNRPRNSEIILGSDVNCNFEIRSTMFQDLIGPNGLINRNLKGNDLLYILKSNQFKILLSYYMHNNYVTYRNFSASKIPHMLDNFICCDKFFKWVTDCKVVTTGARSNHYPIREKFKLTAIKLNIPKEDMIVVDWEKIRTNKDYGRLFNDKLHLSLMEHGIYEPTDGQ